MNQEIDQWSTVADKMEGQDLVVTYNWSTYDKQNGWELVECVIDLHTMTQRNTRSGTERAVKYFYVPMEVDPWNMLVGTLQPTTHSLWCQLNRAIEPT